MSNSLTILKNGAVPSTAFDKADLPTTRLDEGVAGVPYARVSYMGGHWSITHQSQTLPLTRIIDGRQEENPNLDVVILKAAKNPSKAWYAKAFNPDDPPEGPDCFSNDGFKADPTSRNMQNVVDSVHKGCLTCPHNAWGSAKPRDDGSPSRGKACADHKKLVIVPVGDIEAKQYGGPVLLQVPPSSLKRLGPYQNELEVNSFHYAQVHTRITFDRGPGISYPLFKFDALAALDDVQAEQVMKMLKHPLVDQILTTPVQAGDGAWTEAAADRGGAWTEAGAVHKLKPVETKAEAKSEARPNQGMDQPHHGHREPEPKPAPAAAAQTRPVQPEPAPEKPAPADTRSSTAEQLPPGITPEIWAQLPEAAKVAMRAAMPPVEKPPVEKPKRGRPRSNGNRTPQVAPTNMDSAAEKGPPLPEPVGPAATSALPGAGSVGDPALDQINKTLSRAKDLI